MSQVLPRLGAQLFTCREFTRTIEGVAETLKKVKAIGYTAVQISGFGPVDPKAVAKLIADSGLTVAATHVGWPRFLNELDAIIAEHKMWGCTHAAIGALPKDYNSLDGIKRFLAELPPVAEKLLASGIDFSYHNHDHEFTRFGDKTFLEMLYDLTDARHLKAEIDVFWVQAGGGNPVTWIKKYPGRQPLLHLKDMILTMEKGRRFAPVGEGNLEWPAIIAAAGQVGVEWCLVEQDDCYGRDPFDCLASSYRYLKSIANCGIKVD